MHGLTLICCFETKVLPRALRRALKYCVLEALLIVRLVSGPVKFIMSANIHRSCIN